MIKEKHAYQVFIGRSIFIYWYQGWYQSRWICSLQFICLPVIPPFLSRTSYIIFIFSLFPPLMLFNMEWMWNLYISWLKTWSIYNNIVIITYVTKNIKQYIVGWSGTYQCLQKFKWYCILSYMFIFFEYWWERDESKKACGGEIRLM